MKKYKIMAISIIFVVAGMLFFLNSNYVSEDLNNNTPIVNATELKTIDVTNKINSERKSSVNSKYFPGFDDANEITIESENVEPPVESYMPVDPGDGGNIFFLEAIESEFPIEDELMEMTLLDSKVRESNMPALTVLDDNREEHYELAIESEWPVEQN